MAASSKSHTVVPSTTDPARDSTPEATNRPSTSVVLPAPDGPTSTTLRTAVGLSAAGADRADWEVFVLSAMTNLLARAGAPNRYIHHSPDGVADTRGWRNSGGGYRHQGRLEPPA